MPLNAEQGKRFDDAMAYFKQAKAQFEKCVSGSFCAKQCEGEIERMDLLHERAFKQKRKLELEG